MIETVIRSILSKLAAIGLDLAAGGKGSGKLLDYDGSQVVQCISTGHVILEIGSILIVDRDSYFPAYPVHAQLRMRRKIDIMSFVKIAEIDDLENFAVRRIGHPYVVVAG